MTVSKPTLFMGGEAGPERVSFTPLRAGAGGGAARGGGSRTVNVGAIHVHGITDPKAVGLEIVKRIRGMGEIDFRRPA